MTPSKLTDDLLRLACAVEGWSTPPSPHSILKLLDELDMVLIRSSRLVPPDGRPDTLFECSRALFTMSATPANDIESANALVRVATRAVCRAHRLRSLAHSANKGNPDHDEFI